MPLSLKEIPKQVVAVRNRLRYDPIGMPSSEGNQDDNTEDPSNLSALNLVTRDFPVGNGQGPEIDKMANAAPAPAAAPKFPALSKGMASIYDAPTYQSTGQLNLKPVYQAPAYMAPWTGNAPPLPVLNKSIFDLARGARNAVDTARLPSWMTQNRVMQGSAGAVAGGLLGLGAGHVDRFMGGPEDAPNHLGALGTIIGMLTGLVRRPTT